MELGVIVKRKRIALGLTQAKLAEASGVGVRAIRDIEAGRTEPRRATLEQLRRSLRLQRREVRAPENERKANGR